MLTKFDYLLNAMEHAASSKNPAEAGYSDARKAVFAYVRELEAREPKPAPEFDDAEVNALAIAYRAIASQPREAQGRMLEWLSSLRAGGTEAGEKDRRDAARWRAVARTLHACSTGPHDGYYMTTEEFVGGRFPTAEEYADRLIAASSPSEAPTSTSTTPTTTEGGTHG